MNSIRIRPRNIKGIKSPKKKKAFWNEVRIEKDILWSIQEHDLDAECPQYQAMGNKLIFYGEGVDGTVGLIFIIDKRFKPTVVCSHLFRQVIGVMGQLKFIYPQCVCS